MATLFLVSCLLSCLLLPSPASAVDRNSFKTCEQSGFCKRNRRIADAPKTSHYSVLEESLFLDREVITAELVNQHGIHFDLQLSLFEGGMAHLLIDEKDPRRPRYRVKDVIVGSPKTVKFEKQKSSEGYVTLSFEGNKAIFHLSPFELDFFVGDEPVLSVNNRGLLNMEHQRDRPAKVAAPSDQAEPASEEEEELAREDAKFAVLEEADGGHWEESFKSHKDTKPFGPMSVALDFTFPGSKAVYGIPEHATSFALQPTRGPEISSDPYRLYNLDVFEYEVNNPMALYGAIPYMISHKPGYTVGVLWLNAAETWVDVSKPEHQRFFSRLLGTSHHQIDTHWMSETGLIDAYFFLGPSFAKVFKQYSFLTGTSPLPPSFSLGYHQCRWNYVDEADVKKVDHGFDAHDIPYDVIWLDIEHTDQKKYFTWDSIKFPNPLKMQENISSKKRKMVTIVDPHIKRDNDYYIHKEASDLDLYVKGGDNKAFDGHCWPGSSSWIDFTNPKAREWWAQKFMLDQYKGSSLDLYIWNDMNEPSVFNGPEVTMHKTNLHHGGVEHRDLHNLYGFYQQMATAEGLRLRDNKRPFVLSRAFFAGSQRYGAIWTGDNAAEWSHLQMAVPMILSVSVAGLPFVGSDVGGFFGNPEEELLVRWYQQGAFSPFFRGHAHLDTKRREPWLLGEPYTSMIRSAIRLRYSLLPLWYTLFHQASLDGSPVARPMVVEFPSDPHTFAMDDQMMLGSHLLTKPVASKGQTSTPVYLPGPQGWYDYWTFKHHAGGSTIHVDTPLETFPVFIKAGAVVPKKERVRRSSALMEKDPYTLWVALTKEQTASGDLYIDDGASFGYQEGKYVWKTIAFGNKVLSSSNAAGASPQGGEIAKDVDVERIVIMGLGAAPSKVTGHKGEQLYFTFDRTNNALTIKKPGVLIAENWQITLA